MALKGASVEHEGEDLPDRWSVTPELEELASRWGIRPDRDLVHARARPVRRLDHLGARLVTGPAARGAAFVADFAAALIRAARGTPHPEERRRAVERP